MICIGCDPGKKGAVCVLSEQGIEVLSPLANTEFFLAIDKAKYLSELKMERIVCCIEKVHAMPKQGSVSMFTFGEGYGWLKGVMNTMGIPFQEIPPQTWKKEFGLNSDKQKSVEVAKQLFPNAKLIPDGCKKEQDGLAEALLMAEYARRKL